ncbi:MAG: metallophosphoesterase [Solirubrobacteraceae bacterium]
MLEPSGPPVLSLLALGDTGQPPGFLPFANGQQRVADALAAADEVAPADAVLFLGNSFYPHGLEAAELEERVRVNLVRPYCHFADLSGPDSPRVADACETPAAARHPLPLLAVLGNHDHGSAESARLQREAVPRYLVNWRLVGEPVERVELGHGVSVVFFDSTQLRPPDLERLRDALREAPGEWRIAAAHHPLEDDERSSEIQAAITSSGVPVQLLLAGHLQSLRVGVPGGGSPALQIVSGGGSATERSTHHVLGERFALASPGFARVDLFEAGGEPRLRVTLYSVESGPWLGGSAVEPVAVWQVTRSGVVTPYSGAGPGN